jgi:hypothetical protein
VRKATEALSTEPSRKLAIGLPLLTPRRPVSPRAKLKVPASLLLVCRLPPMLRYSKPVLMVWLPRIHVIRSFRT